MKRFLTLALGMSLSFYALSQTLVKEMDNANTRFIPGAYMKSGEAAIYFSTDDRGYTDSSGTCGYAYIFDFDLQPVNSFCFDWLHPYTVYQERKSIGTEEKTVTKTGHTDLYIAGAPSLADMEGRKTAFVNWVYETAKSTPGVTPESLRKSLRVEGTTIYISVPAHKGEGVYGYDEYLKSTDWFLKSNDNIGSLFNYAITVPIYKGGWNKRTWYDSPTRNLCIAKCHDVARLNDWNGGLYLPFSQTFFNDDEKFEYIRFRAEVKEGYEPGAKASAEASTVNPKQELFGITDSDRDGDGEDDYIVTRYGLHIYGIEIVNDAGEVIYNIPLDVDCIGEPQVEIFKSDNHLLAQISYNWCNSANKQMHTVRFYRIDKTTGVADVVREESQAVAYPNPTSAGTPVVMEFQPSQSTERVITVTNLNGAIMMSSIVESGVSQVAIPTATFTPGIYMFSLTENGMPVETCKIIVR